MNLFFMSLIYPNEELPSIKHRSKDALQIQVDTFQKLLIEGFRANKNIDEIYICNSLPVGTYPNSYKDIYIPELVNNDIHDISCINVPYIKQKMREKRALKALCDWAKKSNYNVHVIIYSLYLPYMRAAIKAKSLYPQLKLSIIIPDIPTELGLASGRSGLLYSIEQYMARKSVTLCKYFDYFILLTEHMKDVLAINANADYCIVEGIAPISYDVPNKANIDRCYNELLIDRSKPCIVYTGTLQEELGIRELVLAFDAKELQNANLVIAGSGPMARELSGLGRRNIRYVGFLDRDKVLLLQSGASMLINPRKADGIYTRYSFPSKTMEYMLSAKPVLCYKLDGIPNEYDKYLHYIDTNIADSIKSILNADKSTYIQRAIDGKYYVLNEKNCHARAQQIIDMWYR